MFVYFLTLICQWPVICWTLPSPYGMNQKPDNFGFFKTGAPAQPRLTWNSLMWIRLTLNSQRFTYLSTCRVLRLRMCINTPREPGVLIASTKGCCWTSPLRVFCPSCFCISLSSDAVVSEESFKNFRMWYNSPTPLAALTGRSWITGSLSLGSEHSMLVGSNSSW